MTEFIAQDIAYPSKSKLFQPMLSTLPAKDKA